MATEQTRAAGEFTLPGLGKLVKAERKERMGRNPSTDEPIKIAAKTTGKFCVAKASGLGARVYQSKRKLPTKAGKVLPASGGYCVCVEYGKAGGIEDPFAGSLSVTR